MKQEVADELPSLSCINDVDDIIAMFLSIDAAESLSETVDNEHRERAQPSGYTV